MTDKLETEAERSGTIVYKPAEAAEVARCRRPLVDAACSTGALVAHDLTPNSSRRMWRILDEDLRDWIRRGYPIGE